MTSAYLAADLVQAVIDGRRLALIVSGQPPSRQPAFAERFKLHPRPGHPASHTALCVFRGRAVLSDRGLHRVLDPQMLPDGEPLAQLLGAAEQASPQAETHQLALAQRLGCEDWAGLVARVEPHGITAGERIYRELVGFADLQPVEG